MEPARSPHTRALIHLERLAHNMRILQARAGTRPLWPAIKANAYGHGADIVARQIPGRESRNIDGKSEAYLVDFWHPWDMYLDKNDRRRPGPIHRDDRAREKAYTSLGFEQIWLDAADQLPFLEEQENGQD